jgi:hypothetical protein
VQVLAEIKLEGGVLVALMLPGMAACKALLRMHESLKQAACNRIAKAALDVAVRHATLQQSVITFADCYLVLDPSNLADHTTLLELATSTRDLHIILQAEGSEQDYVARNLLLLCNAPVHNMRLDPGPQQEHLRLSHSWRHFSFLKILHLTDVLLDDSCVTALNCLTLLKVLGFTTSPGKDLHHFLTNTIEFPRLQTLHVVLANSSELGVQLRVSAAKSWQGSCSREVPSSL